MLLAVEVVTGREAHEHRVDHVVDEVKESRHQEAKVLAQPGIRKQPSRHTTTYLRSLRESSSAEA